MKPSDLDQLKRFRQWGSRTPGHPESHVTGGVEASTGPLGQGVGDAVGMPNDVPMFAPSGLGIAMGNASTEVQRAAHRVTSSNTEDGFAEAVERYILAGSGQP